MGYLSEGEAGMLRSMRLAVDTPKLQPVVRISILGFVLGHKELERGASMSPWVHEQVDSRIKVTSIGSGATGQARYLY